MLNILLFFGANYARRKKQNASEVRSGMVQMNLLPGLLFFVMEIGVI